MSSEFQVEARQLLQMMIHSVYSNKDVFLRELISNASDALDKLRLAALRDDTLEADVSDLRIAIETDPQARILTVRDNGIGMSYDEVGELIGTIANSGTAKFLQEWRDAQDTAAAEGLIGQLGVGFYSAFMVADEVTLLTRRAGQSQGTRWTSSGEGTYTIEEVDEAPQGTAVTLRLKPMDTEDQLHDYTSAWTIREIVKRYSDFINWPIRTVTSADQATEGTDDADGENTAAEPETLNSMKALWAQDRQIQRMHRRLTKKVLPTIKEWMAGDPERHAAFWREFGRALKEGLLSDFDNREAILNVCSFASTHHAEEPTSLRQYVERMKEGQEHIFYITGESRQAVENSPHPEAFRAKGIEVLLLTDPVDAVWVDTVPEFDGRQLQSVAKGEIDLGSAEEGDDSSTGTERENRRQEYAGLLARLTDQLGQNVKEVRLPSRLTVSPACLVSDTHDITPALEAVYRTMGQDVPTPSASSNSTPTTPW